MKAIEFAKLNEREQYKRVKEVERLLRDVGVDDKDVAEYLGISRHEVNTLFIRYLATDEELDELDELLTGCYQGMRKN